MASQFTIVFLIAIFGYTTSDPIIFKDCGSIDTIKKMDVLGCSKLPCIFNKGQNYTMTIDFVSSIITL